MKSSKLVLVLALALLASAGSAQVTGNLKRTINKTDRFEFGAGGSVVITGAPVGSIKIAAHPSNEIEISATIEIEAATEADLAKLSEITGFVTDESRIKTSIVTIGTHNSFGMKKLPKDFPKRLLGLPYAVHYVMLVPKYTDLDVDAGKGDFSVTGVEGSMRVNLLESNAKVELIGGNAMFVIGSGGLDLSVGPRGWRGRLVDVQLATGSMIVRLPSNLSAELDVSILRSGSIDNTLTDIKPRDRKVPFSERAISARAGVGGAPLKFVVGEGTIRLERLTQPM